VWFHVHLLSTAPFNIVRWIPTLSDRNFRKMPLPFSRYISRLSGRTGNHGSWMPCGTTAISTPIFPLLPCIKTKSSGISSSVLTIVSGTSETPALALAPLGVHQDYQCMGIGASLIEEGLEECRRLGHRIVIVVGHPGYYPRFGFTRAKEAGIVPPFSCPDNAFMALPLEPGALDGIGGIVRYPEAFDATGAHTS